VLDELQPGANGIGGACVATQVKRNDWAEALELALCGFVGWMARQSPTCSRRCRRSSGS